LTWGLGARISPSHVIQTSQGVTFLPPSQTDTIYSGFLQYELPVIANQLTLTAGTKLEHNNFTGFEYQPSVRLLWTPTARQTFWGAVTRAVRTPSRQDQDIVFDIFDEFYTPAPGATPIPLYFQIEGNPQLKAEQLIGYELGYRTQASSRVYVDVAAFYNVYNNLQAYGAASLGEAPIVPTPPLPASPVYLYFALPYANVVEGTSVGVEIAPNWKVTHWWQLRGSYSLLHLDLKDKPGFANVGGLLSSYVGVSPSNMVGVQSSINLPKNFELDESYRYVSTLPSEGIRGYDTADGRLGWHFREHAEFSIVGQNLFRPYHNEFAGDPNTTVGIKRSVYLKATWNP
jgi:iron complex outermembrane receptor protein